MLRYDKIWILNREVYYSVESFYDDLRGFSAEFRDFNSELKVFMMIGEI